MTELSSGEFGRCITLVVMKELLRRISRRNRVSTLGVTNRTPTPTGSGDLVTGCSFCLGAEIRSWGSKPLS